MLEITRVQVRNKTFISYPAVKSIIINVGPILAFDVVFPNKDVPYLGVLRNKLSAFWNDYTKGIIPNRMISINSADMPEDFQSDDRCMLVKRLKILPIECVVQGYIVGSNWKSYQKSGSVCGIKLPKGLKESERLPMPIYIPSAITVDGRYEPVSFEETVEIIGEELATQIKHKSIELYLICSYYARNKGIIIADAKFQFGIDGNDNLVLADDIMIPEHSTFWSADEYVVGKPPKSYDKQPLIDWLAQNGWNKTLPPPMIPDDVVSYMVQKYATAYETLTGSKIQSFSIC